ncbi:MAG TPA: hypothetical protein VHW91_07565 [Candidatus Dormibacteraeota bacterium]|nr:hypothetical protein [Candidatus Dormibacteraeota bacterium]
MRRRSILIAAGGCLGMLGAAVLLAEPALADNQLSADTRALALASRHQVAIDTAIQQFLTRSSGGGESDDLLLTQSAANLAQYESARKLIENDQLAVQSALQPDWLVAGAAGKGEALQTARLHSSTALTALGHADQVLTAAVDQERLQNAFFFAAVTEAKMLTAIDNQQYVAIDGLYAQADHALRVAEALMGKPDQTPGVKPAIVAMRTILDQTQKYGAALLRNDKTEADTRHTAMRAAYATLAAATNATAVTANDDWNDRIYQPLIAAYHSGLAAILS